MHKKNHFRYIQAMLLMSLLFLQSSCKKYLDKKPVDNLAVPSNLQDLQAILDNQVANTHSPGFLELVADNYYISTASLSSIGVDERMNYLWDKDAKVTISNSIWNNPYKAIYQANFVLDYLPEISIGESDKIRSNSIKGTALFYRAFMFHQLSQLFCKPYSSSSPSDLGIVLRTTSFVGASVARSTVQQTYDQVIDDLRSAAQLLPVTSTFATRPNKAAAYGALARVFLSMRDYSSALLYADSALAISNTLLDYNTLKPSSNPGLPDNYLNNPEILYVSYVTSTVFNSSRIAITDSVLYKSYDANDLRKTVFFESVANENYWKGSYYSTASYFSIFDGIATDEIYLIRSEARARSGSKDAAMDDLNTLLNKRWKTGTFTNLTAATSADALIIILNERRKELLFRGLRWSDLRRFNLEGANVTLRRIYNGSTYILPPNDLRWVMQIPELEVNRSGISQNPR